jgi:hypothetical protein
MTQKERQEDKIGKRRKYREKNKNTKGKKLPEEM